MTMRKIKPKQDDYMLGGSKPMRPEKSPPRYPTMRLDLDTIPEAKKWDISKAGSEDGPEYIIELKVKMTGISQSRYDNSAEFELREIETESADEEASEDS